MFTTGDPRTWHRALALAAALLSASLLFQPRVFKGVAEFPNDHHASASLDLAVNLSFCRRTGMLSTVFGPARHLKLHPEAMATPMRDLLIQQSGSVGQYCSTLGLPFVNNENTLMLLMSAAWFGAPELSVNGIGRLLRGVRIMAVAVFSFAALSAGTSVALTFAALLAAIRVMVEVNRYEYTVYPFLIVIPLAWAALCSLGAGALRGSSAARFAAIGGAGGVAAAIAANLRTSYWPLIVVMTAMALVAVARTTRADTRYRHITIAAAVFGVAAWLFQAVAIAPLQRSAPGAVNYTYHTVAHPLVIGLAVPPNALSRAEHIEWDDSSGAEIARRADPSVRFLGPEYESALYRFYFGLWRTMPAQMLRTYKLKLLTAGRGVFLQASQLIPEWRLFRRVYLVWADRVNGAMLLAGALAWTVLAWLRADRGSSAALLAGLAGAATVLLITEAAVIFSTFFLAYHGFLLFVVLVAPAVVLQAALDFLSRPPIVTSRL